MTTAIHVPRRRPALRRLFVAMLTAVAVLTGGVGHAAAQGSTPPRGGALKFIYLEPVTLNPATFAGVSAGIYGAQLFASLVQLDDQFNPRPYLAERWEMSADGKTYTFHLVKGATFHDGRPITADDVKFTAETIKVVHPQGPTMFRYLDAVDAPNPSTVVFRFSKPNPLALRTLAPPMFPILPRHVYGVGDIRQNPANRKPVGSGPFKFGEWQQGRFLIFERYDGFFRKGRPYLDRIIYEFVPDPATRVAALENGSTDVAPWAFVPFIDARRLEKTPNLSVTFNGSEGYGAITFMFFNVRNQYVKDVKVRQAIAHAIDRDFVANELMYGFGKPATAPVTSANPFHASDVRRYEYSLEKANRLLDEAGFKRGADGIRFKLNHELLGAFPDVIRTVAEYMRQQLKQVGIDVVMRPSPDFATYTSRVYGNWDFDITVDFVGLYSDPVLLLDRVFLTSSIRKGVPYSNGMGYSNPEVDRLLVDAQVEPNLEKRKALYRRVQQILVEDLPALPIAELRFPTVYHRNLGGLPSGAFGMLDAYDTIHWAKPKPGS